MSLCRKSEWRQHVNSLTADVVFAENKMKLIQIISQISVPKQVLIENFVIFNPDIFVFKSSFVA